MTEFFHPRAFLLFTLILLVSPSEASRGTHSAAGEPAAAAQAIPADPAPEGTLRLLTWNVAHGRADSFHQALLEREEVEGNLKRIAGVLRAANPDVVALQEADGPSAWSGGFDHVDVLGRLTGLEHTFHGDHNPFDLSDLELSSGTALLSRRPLGDVLSRSFGANWRDTKGFVVGTVEIPGTGRLVDLVSVHLDFLRPAERQKQILAMAEALEGRDRPLIVLGDLNCAAGPSAEAFQLLVGRLDLRPYRPELHQPTFPSSRPARRIDWILVSDELEFVSHRTVDARLSDHLGVVAEVRLVG